MAENKDDLLQHYRQTREGLMSAIDGLSDEQMSEPSLDGWSVKDHLAHLALWDDLRAMEVERVSAGHESAWKFPEAQEDAFNEVGYELRRSLSAAQARWELQITHPGEGASISLRPVAPLNPCSKATPHRLAWLRASV